MTTGVNSRAETWARTWLIWEPYFLLLFFTFQPEGEQHPSLGGNSLWNVLSFSALYKKLWTWNCRPSHPHCWINMTCKHKSSFMLSQARLSPPPWGDSSTSLCFVISGGWSWCRPCKRRGHDYFFSSCKQNIYQRSEEAGGGLEEGTTAFKRYLGSMSFRGFPEKQLLAGKVFTPGWTEQG